MMAIRQDWAVTLTARWACALVLGASSAAGAQPGLPDPTRPPLVARPAASISASESSVPVLQSVLIARDRRSAVISGETVTVGQRYGGARVVRITETEVVLKGNDGVTTLKLFPEVDKQVRHGGPRPAPAAETGKRSSAPETRTHDA